MALSFSQRWHPKTRLIYSQRHIDKIKRYYNSDEFWICERTQAGESLEAFKTELRNAPPPLTELEFSNYKSEALENTGEARFVRIKARYLDILMISLVLVDETETILDAECPDGSWLSGNYY